MDKLEYIWLDGTEPTAQLRSKTKIVKSFDRCCGEAPIWGFDGSSTQQAEGSDSDCVLKPVRLYPNPLEKGNHTLVLCEVWTVNNHSHETNTRHMLDLTLQYLDDDTIDEWVGFEQEYTLYENGLPFGWPEIGEPPPQGDYYCGRNAGEEIVTEHTDACIEAGISIAGTNAEVMLGQWEYQIGAGGSLHMSDDLWIARWLMEKICYKHGITVSLDPKPIEGDWNGAGCHTNFSTRYMREDGGIEIIFKACMDLEKVHEEHMKEYGEGNERRLTGLHETQAMDTFSWGVSDRGASIRIPWQVDKDKCGYLEDRRPSSNCDPYRVSKKMIETICN
jgi:glutamine synthetase